MNKRQKKKRLKKHMTKVDAYYVPIELADAYIADRERLASRVKAYFQSRCHYVCRDWRGSQDGEAVICQDKMHQIVAFIHLDPYGIEAMKRAEDAGELDKWLDQLFD